jgi:hypothetical protein
MTIIVPARNDVPVQVWHQISQAGEIDLVRREQFTQRALNGSDNAHQMACLSFWQIAHLRHVGLPNDAAKAGKCGTFMPCHPHYAAVRIAP